MIVSSDICPTTNRYYYWQEKFCAFDKKFHIKLASINFGLLNFLYFCNCNTNCISIITRTCAKKPQLF